MSHIALISLIPFVLSFQNLNAEKHPGSNTTDPVVIKTIAPSVSKSTRNGLTVSMKLTVTENGKAANIQPTVQFPNLDPEQRDLAAAAILALQHWKFEPARDGDGNAVAKDVVIPITYSKTRVRSLQSEAIAGN